MEYLTVKSKRGADKIIFEEATYLKKNTSATGHVIWRCNHSTCLARLKMDGAKIVSAYAGHNHDILHGTSRVAKAREKMCVAASTTEESTSVILERSLTGINPSDGHLLPQISSMRKYIRLVKQRQRNAYNPGDEVLTVSGELFLQADNEDFIMFTTKSDLRILLKNRNWFADGTLLGSAKTKNGSR